jgi:hypothetical protein
MVEERVQKMRALAARHGRKLRFGILLQLIPRASPGWDQGAGGGGGGCGAGTGGACGSGLGLCSSR